MRFEARRELNFLRDHEPENVVPDRVLLGIDVLDQFRQVLLAMAFELALEIGVEPAEVVERGEPHDQTAKLRRMGKPFKALRKAFQQNIRDRGHVQQMADQGMPSVVPGPSPRMKEIAS